MILLYDATSALASRNALVSRGDVRWRQSRGERSPITLGVNRSSLAVHRRLLVHNWLLLYVRNGLRDGDGLHVHGLLLDVRDLLRLLVGSVRSAARATETADEAASAAIAAVAAAVVVHGEGGGVGVWVCGGS
jgi:hypothetical protein